TWVTNSNGKTVMKGNTLKPEQVCYLDTSFTKVIKNGGISWQKKPIVIGIPTSRDESKMQIKVNVDNLRIRKNPNGNILGYIKNGIYDIIDTQVSSNYTWYKTNYGWVAYDKKWSVILPKKESAIEKQIINEEKNNSPSIELEIETEKNKKEIANISIWKRIYIFLKKIFS
ncbi:MAG: hypothetical protein PUD59_00365, partial [bacterium]|nr:hypothetical protein [bacterium]